MAAWGDKIIRTFLSYRRRDTEGVVQRVHARLRHHYSTEAVFRDVASIRLGADFRDAVSAALLKSDSVLVFIGSHWLDTHAPSGQPRIFHPADPVRMEVEIALSLNKHIVPILVDGATMPAGSALPPSVAILSFLNAASLRTGSTFDFDMDALVRGLERAHGFPTTFDLVSDDDNMGHHYE